MYYRFLLSRRNIMAIISSTRLERREGACKNSCLPNIFTSVIRIYLLAHIGYIFSNMLDIFVWICWIYLFEYVGYISGGILSEVGRTVRLAWFSVKQKMRYSQSFHIINSQSFHVIILKAITQNITFYKSYLLHNI